MSFIWTQLELGKHTRMKEGKWHEGTKRMMVVILDSIKTFPNIYWAPTMWRKKEIKETISVHDNVHVAPSERMLSFQDTVTHFPQQA